MNRREFLFTAGGGLLSLAGPRLLDAEPGSGKFYFAVIADSHIIDDFYTGPEGSPEDTESIFKTTERLTRTRDFLNAVTPKMDLTFLVGDYFHNYPSTDLDFYFQNKTRVDRAKELTDAFAMPVHAGFGNHDYAVPKVTREQSHELFRRKFNLKPYYAVEHNGFKFVHLNNFLGDTWKAGSQIYAKGKGSLGEEQLNWFEAELRQHKPTFVFIHYPLRIVLPVEKADYGLHTLLKKHEPTIERVVSGHWHRWVDIGREFGPEHLVIAATRYDPNAYLIVEADTKNASHRLLNIDLVEWDTHFSKAWPGAPA
ncbi:MAG: metallophosphoesterase [Bryobacteraceae bacterium]